MNVKPLHTSSPDTNSLMLLVLEELCSLNKKVDELNAKNQKLELELLSIKTDTSFIASLYTNPCTQEKQVKRRSKKTKAEEILEFEKHLLRRKPM